MLLVRLLLWTAVGPSGNVWDSPVRWEQRMSNDTVRFRMKFTHGDMFINYSLENGHIQKYTWNSKRHCNAEYELHVILRGKCLLDVEDSHHNLHAGQAVLIAPGKYHKPHTPYGEFERFSIGFSLPNGPLLNSLRNKVDESKVFVPTEDFMTYCNKLIAEGMYKNPLREAAQSSLLTLLTVSLFRNLHLVQYVEPDRRKQEEQERTHLIDNYFERNFSEKNGASILAEQLHLSIRQLNRVLKEHYGMGFQEKLIQARMDHAALLLRTTDTNVQEIINIVGYNSQTAFYKAFCNQFGITPRQYRLKHK